MRSGIWLRIVLLIMIVFTFVGCKAISREPSDRYADFNCYEKPLYESFSSVGLPSLFESIQISFVDEPSDYSPGDVIYLELKNQSDVSIWFPAKMNLIIWKEISENNWRGIPNLSEG